MSVETLELRVTQARQIVMAEDRSALWLSAGTVTVIPCCWQLRNTANRPGRADWRRSVLGVVCEFRLKQPIDTLPVIIFCGVKECC
jgi:hypothetical protein